VQIAAFRTQSEAKRLHARLVARGYDARVAHAGTLWRVRVGRYATRDAAVAALGRVRAAKLDGIVVEAERE
jgi:cell division protein FtsN